MKCTTSSDHLMKIPATSYWAVTDWTLTSFTEMRIDAVDLNPAVMRTVLQLPYNDREEKSLHLHNAISSFRKVCTCRPIKIVSSYPCGTWLAPERHMGQPGRLHLNSTCQACKIEGGLTYSLGSICRPPLRIVQSGSGSL